MEWECCKVLMNLSGDEWRMDDIAGLTIGVDAGVAADVDEDVNVC